MQQMSVTAAPPRRQGGVQSLTVPSAAFWIVTCMLAWMVPWILISPGSWKSGVWPEYADWLSTHPRGDISRVPAPRDVNTKYKGQTAVVFTHHLPSAVWATCIPLQLSSMIRTRSPRLHRLLGYTTVASAATLSSGALLIQYVGIAGTEHSALLIINAWFLLTLVKAVAAARRHAYTSHRVWMLRHTAAGLWVVLQRMFLVMLSACDHMGFVDWTTATEQQKLDIFKNCGGLATAICYGSLEAMLWRERSRQAAVKAKVA